MEPLPNANKAYSMVLRVEKQREVNLSYLVTQDNNAFFVKTQQGINERDKIPQGRGRGLQNQGSGRGRGRANDKASRYCDYCGTTGHVRETYFQLNGYPEWYQQLKGHKENANLVKSDPKITSDFCDESTTKQSSSVTGMFQGL